MNASIVLAYLDPGTGSVVLQIVVGGILGGLLVIKLAWKRVVGLFRPDWNTAGEEADASKETVGDSGAGK